MATVIRPEVSLQNKYWISKHRHYELKHFCLQYPNWKKAYANYEDTSLSLSTMKDTPVRNLPSDPTARRAILKAYYAEKIDLVEQVAKEADPYLYQYIIKAVTEGLSYTYLRTRLQIPCGRDLYYDRYRRFFWLLSEARN